MSILGRLFVVLAVFVALIGPVSPADAASSITVEVVSSPADQVSGDAARLRISVPPGLTDKAAVLVNGVDQSANFVAIDDGLLDGVVDGLVVGENTVEVTVRGRVIGARPGGSVVGATRVTLVNHPITGPIFSGPQQDPFFCATEGDYGNAELDGPVDADCSMDTTVSFKYRTTSGGWADYDPGRRPTGEHGHHHHDERGNRRLHRPLGAGHDQPVHLFDRSTVAERPGRGRARPVGLEQTAHLLLPGWASPSATTRVTRAGVGCCTTTDSVSGMPSPTRPAPRPARTTTWSSAVRRR